MQGTMQMLVRRSANAGNHAAFPAIARSTPRDALDQLEQFGTTVTIPHDGEIVGQGDRAEFCYRILSGSGPVGWPATGGHHFYPARYHEWPPLRT